jgi:hypothetical protein
MHRRVRSAKVVSVVWALAGDGRWHRADDHGHGTARIACGDIVRVGTLRNGDRKGPNERGAFDVCPACRCDELHVVARDLGV